MNVERGGDIVARAYAGSGARSRRSFTAARLVLAICFGGCGGSGSQVGELPESVVPSTPPPTNTSCAKAEMVQDGTALKKVDLSVANQVPSDCGSGPLYPALYYAATIPSGQRMTVGAIPMSGDWPWAPAIQLTTSCADTFCLAIGIAGVFGGYTRTLRYENNGPNPLSVILAVYADPSHSVVRHPTFNLNVRIVDPFLNGSPYP